MVSQVSRIQSDLIVIGLETLLRIVLNQAQKDHYPYADLPLIPPEQLDTHLVARGSAYNVDVMVDGMKTRGLLDHGAQVFLVHRQLFPVMKKRTIGQQSNVNVEC